MPEFIEIKLNIHFLLKRIAK